MTIVAYENPNDPQLGPMILSISDLNAYDFTLTFPIENDVDWQED